MSLLVGVSQSFDVNHCEVYRRRKLLRNSSANHPLFLKSYAINDGLVLIGDIRLVAGRLGHVDPRQVKLLFKSYASTDDQRTARLRV